jgi:hypothetical protein
MVQDGVCRNSWRAAGRLQTGSEVDVIKPAPVGSRQAGLIEQIGNAAVEAIMDVLHDGRFSAVPGHLPRPASRIRRTLRIRPGRRTLNNLSSLFHPETPAESSGFLSRTKWYHLTLRDGLPQPQRPVPQVVSRSSDPK